MSWLVVLCLIILICFSLVLLVGAPYLPTLRPQVKAALELAKLQPGQTLIELGAGDGRVVVGAARQGYKVIAYELNPILAIVIWLRTRRYRHQVRIICADYWQQQWPPAEAVFTFLLPKYMSKLDRKMKAYKGSPVSLVSFAFKIPGRPIDGQKNGVFLYKYD
jgi:hypothetical protein